MNKSPFYGWKLVAVLFCVYFAANMALVGGNITNTYMAKQINMSRSLFGAGFALAYLLVGLASPLAASIGNKKGERFTLSVGLFAIGISCLLMVFFGDSSLGYILAYGLVMGLGCALATVLPIQTLITRWFKLKRALATGLVLSAGGFAGIISSLSIKKMIDSFIGNWRIPWIFLAILMGIAAIITILFTKNNPEDFGQIQDGIQKPNVDSTNSTHNTQKRIFLTSENWVLKDAFKTKALWLLLLAAVAQFGIFYLCVNHSMIHLLDIGVSDTTAALAPGILLLASTGSRLLSGVLGDRIEPRYIISAGLLLSLGGCIILLNAVSTFAIYLFAILVGTGFGLVYVCLFTMLGNYYGVEKIRSFLGFMIPIVTFFGAVAPFLGGIVKDKIGSYEPVFIGAIILAAFGTFGILFALPPIKKKI